MVWRSPLSRTLPEHMCLCTGHCLSWCHAVCRVHSDEVALNWTQAVRAVQNLRSLPSPRWAVLLWQRLVLLLIPLVAGH